MITIYLKASVACDGMESPKAYGITRSVDYVGLIPYIPFGMIPYRNELRIPCKASP